VFLHSNGYDFVFHEGLKQELIDFSIKIAVKSVDFQEISSYIFNNVRLNLFNEEWHTIEQLRDDKSQE
ncbi:MAG: type II toxin-antitoxin system death-on-curing family toxin, partial [Lentilactobacillus parabuchneri]|nr:type II toxin-antitoxin system death-on-curing family toxin [Lentilactobacillus parabuchneri]